MELKCRNQIGEERCEDIRLDRAGGWDTLNALMAVKPADRGE